MSKPLVYVAGPITGDPWGCVRKATEAAATLDGLGLLAYLPQLSVLHEMVDPPAVREVDRARHRDGRTL